MKQCSVCGRIVTDDTAVFCEDCGGLLVEVVEENPAENTEKKAPEKKKAKREKTETEEAKRKGLIALSVLGCAVFLLFAVAGFAISGWKKGKEEAGQASGNGNVSVVSDSLEDVAGTEDASFEAESQDAMREEDGSRLPSYDLDATGDTPVTLSGILRYLDGEYVLSLSPGVSVLFERDGEKYVLENLCEVAVFSREAISDYENLEVAVVGALSYDGTDDGARIISSRIIGQLPGKEEEKQQKTETAAAEDDYLLPDSNKRYLTENDVAGMSLQEINYAKNEIFARHGRKFKAKELKDYFGSKSWYQGTVEPDDFDSEYIRAVMNDYERKNMEFLAAKEESISSGGYQPK